MVFGGGGGIGGVAGSGVVDLLPFRSLARVSLKLELRFLGEYLPKSLFRTTNGIMMISGALAKPTPIPARIWNPYWDAWILRESLAKDRPTVPAIWKRLASTAKYIGGILVLLIKIAAIVPETGMKIPNGINRVPALKAVLPLTVWKRCGSWIVQTVRTPPAKKTFLCRYIGQCSEYLWQSNYLQSHSNDTSVLEKAPGKDRLWKLSFSSHEPLPKQE